MRVFVKYTVNNLPEMKFVATKLNVYIYIYMYELTRGYSEYK